MVKRSRPHIPYGPGLRDDKIRDGKAASVPGTTGDVTEQEAGEAATNLAPKLIYEVSRAPAKRNWRAR